MQFQIQEVNEIPRAIFGDDSRSWLLTFFLQDAEHHIADFLEEIRKAEQGEKAPSGFTCNHVDVEFYPDRAVIEDLYPEDEEAEPERIQLSLAEAKQLLLDWQAALEQWRAQQAA